MFCGYLWCINYGRIVFVINYVIARKAPLSGLCIGACRMIYNFTVCFDEELAIVFDINHPITLYPTY